MKNQKRLTLALLAAMVLSVALLALVFFCLSGAHLHTHEAPVELLSGSLSEQQSAQTRVLTITLPEAFDQAQSILFKTTHTRVEVSVERDTVYRFGY